jgi:hypothetical protein
MRRGLVAVGVLLLVTAGCLGITGTDSTDEPGTITSPQASDTPPTDSGPTDEPDTDTPGATETPSEPPPDPPEDRLGWENGYWYNESIDIDPSDGLNNTELAAVVNRSMARVERVRELEFNRTVPVEVISREEFASERSGRYQNVSGAGRLHHLVRLEARFFANETTDPLGIQQSTTSSGVGGFYDPNEDRIVIISETTPPRMDEIILSQELFHALQVRKFPEYTLLIDESLTVEKHNRYDIVTEGDGHLVDQRYQDRCEAGWDCIRPESEDGTDGGSPDIHRGIANTFNFPYTTGVTFVRDIQERNGWDAVDELYENPVASTEQAIHPEKFREDQPTEITYRDRSSSEWEVLPRTNDSKAIGFLQTGASNMTFGESGIYTMLWYPSYRATQQAGEVRDIVIPYFDHYNLTGTGNLSSTDPLNYDHPASAGWDGDKLVPYVTDDSAETNETGYVWKSVWDSEEDATEFMSAYEQLLTYHGAESAEGKEDTYHIPEGNGFADAFYVHQDGDTVTIVNAPSVDDLGDVHAPAGS